MVDRAIQITREFVRIARLPRRTWDPDDSTFADQLTAAIKKPHGTMRLRPIQAQALYEASVCRGLVGAIAVGEGKTLISLLIPFVRNLRRPLLVTRANLVEKTKRERIELAYHWPIPNFIRIESYDWLAREKQADFFLRYQPDGVFFDECDALKNKKTAVASRYDRYLQTKIAADLNVETYVASGTLIHRSIKNAAHLIRWALKPANAPIPANWHEMEEWSEVLDERPNVKGHDILPGALLQLGPTNPMVDPYESARRAFQSRLVQTPGVVASREDKLGVSLIIQAVECSMSRATDEAFDFVRKYELPNGKEMNCAMSVHGIAREVALGFYYQWDPPPPVIWREALKSWCKAARKILSNNRRDLDTELQVVHAIDAGHYPEEKDALDAWRAIKHTFTPNTVPVWIDDSVIDFAANWAMQAPGIVWCEHVAFAERLAWKTGMSYYREAGCDRRGNPIESHDPARSLIASEASNYQGRNLQKWSRNLIVSVSSAGHRLEQQIGRTHRQGQKAPFVQVDVLVTCFEHVKAFEQSRKDASAQSQMLGKPMRLCYADIVFPTIDEITKRDSPRWRK